MGLCRGSEWSSSQRCDCSFATVSFPVASGSNREIIEGAVGIFAVAMMICWYLLHSKASIEKWNDFMESQMKAVTATGSFLSMFALSFRSFP